MNQSVKVVNRRWLRVKRVLAERGRGKVVRYDDNEIYAERGDAEEKFSDRGLGCRAGRRACKYKGIPEQKASLFALARGITPLKCAS